MSDSTIQRAFYGCAKTGKDREASLNSRFSKADIWTECQLWGSFSPPVENW
jgi:hypothetical protein